MAFFKREGGANEMGVTSNTLNSALDSNQEFSIMDPKTYNGVNDDLLMFH